MRHQLAAQAAAAETRRSAQQEQQTKGELVAIVQRGVLVAVAVHRWQPLTQQHRTERQAAQVSHHRSQEHLLLVAVVAAVAHRAVSVSALLVVLAVVVQVRPPLPVAQVP
jgi:hypothetical protein